MTDSTRGAARRLAATERENEWLEALYRAFRHVPLNLYDEHQKPAEQAVQSMIAERERLADALQAIIDQDTRPFPNWMAYIWFIRDIAQNALSPPEKLIVGKHPRKPGGDTVALHD